MDITVGKWYVCRAGTLRNVVFRVTAVNDNGSVEIETSQYHKRMNFGLLEIRDEMKISELK